MPESTPLSGLLEDLTARARQRGLNDAQWCRAAGLRKETLSRLRSRENCDAATLMALASAVGSRLAVVGGNTVETTADGHFPQALDRDHEDRLIDVVAAAPADPAAWRAAGPAFFMAGLAVMAASAREFDRRRLLEVAEALHPGSSEPEVFQLWLDRSPVRPSRFLPMVRQRMRHAA